MAHESQSPDRAIALDFDAERLFEEFEAAWSPASIGQIGELVANRPPSEQAALLGELVRIDLELRTRNGGQPRVEDYLQQFAVLGRDRDVLSAVAFEHFRLQQQAGRAADPVEYRRRFGVDTTGWSTAEAAGFAATPREGGSGASRVGPAARDADGFPGVPGLFAGHELVGLLGEGAFSRVFLARQGDLARRFVTLKVTREASSEPDCLARLQHSGIVPIYSVHREGSLQAICMPFLGSLTLADLISQLPRENIPDASGRELVSTAAARWLETRRDTRGPASVVAVSEAIAVAAPAFARAGPGSRSAVPVDGSAGRFDALGDRNFSATAAWLFRQLAEGLEHAHGQGIVHGDIKPANILIADDGHPLLLDFNLARQAGAASAGFVGGTLAYMAPEQLQGYERGVAGDERSDLYALGLVMHELLAGKRAFPDRSGTLAVVLASMVADRTLPPPSLFSLRPPLDRDLCQIVGKCLEPDPRRRYPSAAALVEDLRRQAEFRPLRIAPNGSPWHRLKKWTRRHPRMTSLGSVATVAAILLGLAGTGWALRGRQLEQIAARESSIRFVRQLQEQQLPLTGLGLPESMLDDALQAVKKTLAGNEASDPQQLERARRFQQLPEPQQQRERRTVSASWYLLAERLVDQSQGQPAELRAELLKDAGALNRQAREVRGGLASSPALDAQDRRIRALETGTELPAQPASPSLATIEPGDSTDFRLAAMDLLRRREFLSAAGLLRKWVEAEPNDAGAWLLLGNALAGAGKLADADAALGVCLALDDGLELAWFNRGRTRLDRGDLPGAIADFGEAIRLNPLEPASHANRGQLRLATGDAQGALEDFGRAIDLGARDTRVWYYRARAWRAAGKEAEATADTQQFLTEEPLDADGWALRGFVRHQAGDLDGALADYAAALELNPVLLTALQNRANIFAEQKDQPAAALADMDRIVASRPGDPVALVTRGVLHARLGDRDKAVADAEAALRLSQAGDTLYRAAGIFAQTSQQEPADRARAVALIAAALLRDPVAVEKYWAGDRDLKPLAEDRELLQLREWVAAMRALTASPTQPEK